jgi:hypothetical protein
MSVHWINVAEALRAALATQLGTTVERRYTAYYDPEEVVDGKIIVIGGASDLDGKRKIDLLEIGVDVGYQRALPNGTTAYPDPRNNLPFLDGCSQLVQSIKNLFSEDGPLREAEFAGATYLRWRNDPLYRPDMLLDHSIFTSVIRFEFRIED